MKTSALYKIINWSTSEVLMHTRYLNLLLTCGPGYIRSDTFSDSQGTSTENTEEYEGLSCYAPREATTVSKVVNMQTHPGFFKAASLMSLLLAAESRAELQILCSNLEMMAGQPRVGVLNLTFCPVSAGLTAFAACPVCGKGKRNRDRLVGVPGL